MSRPTLDLWTLVRKRPQIDPHDLAEALRAEIPGLSQDYRPRLLVRDSLDALRGFWGEVRYRRWLSEIPEGNELDALSREEFDEIGYPSLRGRLMQTTDPEDVRQYLLELGRSVHQPRRIDIGGSIALILSGHVVRHTEAIDIVGEMPPEIRDNHQLLEELKNSYGLHLGHVQSHYFPTGWQERAHSLGIFGRLQVFLLDVYDIFMSKLFSARRKDIDDLRMLARQLDKDVLVRRLKETAGSFLADSRLLQLATDNWQLLFGEDLPP